MGSFFSIFSDWIPSSQYLKLVFFSLDKKIVILSTYALAISKNVRGRFNGSVIFSDVCDKGTVSRELCEWFLHDFF